MASSTAEAGGATQKFRRQHEELVALSVEILDGCRALPAGAADVRRLLARFAGKLNVHATMENEALYPRLLGHDDANVRSVAERLFGELDTIYGAFGEYLKRWPSADAVAADAPTFVRHTQEVLFALGRRMRREDSALYPLVDAAEAVGQRSSGG